MKHRGADQIAQTARDLTSRIRWGEVGLVLLAYTLLTIVITWPVILNFSSEIPGETSGGDRSGYVWDFWLHSREGLALWGADIQEAVAAPFGRTSPASAHVTLFVTLGPGWLVTSIAGPIVAYNVTVFSGLTLSGAAMYMLIRWLGLGRTSAAWSGAAFILVPYVALRATSHLPFVHLESFPLLLMAGIFWLERPNLRRAVLMTLAIVLAWLTNPYYGLMALIIAAVFVVIGLVLGTRRNGPIPAARSALEVGGSVLVLVGLPLLALYSSSRDAVVQGFERDPIELQLYGAHFTDYVKPVVGDAFLSGIVGADTWDGLGSPGGERTAFLGFTTIVLALIGLFFLIRRWDSTPQRVRLAAISAMVLVPVLVLMSLSHPYPLPWPFEGSTIPMPAGIVFDFTPFLRAFARFSIAVMAVVLIIAAIGLSGLLRGRTQVTAYAIAALVFVFTIVDLPGTTPTSLVTGSSTPIQINGADADELPAWQWIAEETDPDAVILESPSWPNEALERFYMYGQTVHERRIANGALNDAELAGAFNKDYPLPTVEGAAEAMATIGIDYVTIAPWAFAMLGREGPDPLQPPAGFELAAQFEDGSAIWEVVAAPGDAVVVRRDGFWDTEVIDGQSLRWLGQEGGVTVVADEAGLYEVSFDAAGLDPSATYQLEVRGPDGTVQTLEVTGEKDRYAFQLPLAEGESTVEWRVLTPAAQQISPEDLRVVTIQTGTWDATRVGPTDRRAAAG